MLMTSQLIEKDLTGQKHLEQHRPVLSPQGIGVMVHPVQLLAESGFQIHSIFIK